MQTTSKIQNRLYVQDNTTFQTVIFINLFESYKITIKEIYTFSSLNRLEDLAPNTQPLPPRSWNLHIFQSGVQFGETCRGTSTEPCKRYKCRNMVLSLQETIYFLNIYQRPWLALDIMSREYSNYSISLQSLLIRG